MTPRQPPRTSRCGAAEARTRLTHAAKYLEVAEVVQSESTDFPESATVAASLAVLAGIAASDAACCFALGQRPRGQNHLEATALLAQVQPVGDQAVEHLQRLLALKDKAHYGVLDVGDGELAHALRQASSLVELTRQVVRG